MLALLFLSASITRTTAAPATPEYLDLLGLSAVELPGLDESALKKLYKRRALELHPDKSSHPDAAGRFRRLQEAYEALKDPSARSYFQRFARYGGSLWQNVKTYADDRLTVERRGWVRSARGMRMSTERVRLNDDFVNMREGAVLPLWHNYAANAFAEHGGPWVLLVADHQDRRGTGAVSAAVGAFAKRFADEPWLEVASVNAGAANNEEFARRLWLAAGHKTRRPLCAVVPPAIDGAVPDRLKDLVVVDCEPTESLPLRLARAARAARDAPSPRVDAAPDGSWCQRDDAAQTCSPITSPAAVVVAPGPAPAELAGAIRRAKQKYAPLLDVSLAICDAKNTRTKDCRAGPRVEVVGSGEGATVELKFGTEADEEVAARLDVALSTILALHRRALSQKVPKTVVMAGMGDLARCASPGLDGAYEFAGWAYGRPLWKLHNKMIRWHPGSDRFRGIGSWLLTDVADEDRGWAYFEGDALLPLSSASACWVTFCGQDAEKWSCKPQVGVSLPAATPAPNPSH